MKGVLMRSFDYSRLYEKIWNTDILNLVAKIHECKGRQDLRLPVRLETTDRFSFRYKTNEQ